VLQYLFRQVYEFGPNSHAEANFQEKTAMLDAGVVSNSHLLFSMSYCRVVGVAATLAALAGA
jgi:hypothetical protein